MCVIALVPAGEELTNEQATAMFKTNNDGAGFGWLDRHNQMRTKTFMDFGDFWNAYKGTVQGYRDREFLVHFRIGTHGARSIENVHPFRVDHNTIMAHNGIIRCVQDYKDGRSDTRVFVEETLPLLPDLWLDSPQLRWLVEDAIGASRLVFLTNDPRLSQTTYILNEKAGSRLENGIWVSNKNWEWELPGRAKVTTFYPSGRQLHSGGVGGGKWYPMGNGKEKYSLDDILKADEVAAELEAEEATRQLALPATVGFDVFKMKGMIEDQRNTLGFKQKVAFIDGEWTCWGCYNELDEKGECLCFEAVCLECYEWAADCECNPDIKNIVEVDDIINDPEHYEKHLTNLAALSTDLADAKEFLIDLQEDEHPFSKV